MKIKKWKTNDKLIGFAKIFRTILVVGFSGSTKMFSFSGWIETTFSIFLLSNVGNGEPSRVDGDHWSNLEVFLAERARGEREGGVVIFMALLRIPFWFYCIMKFQKFCNSHWWSLCFQKEGLPLFWNVIACTCMILNCSWRSNIIPHVKWRQNSCWPWGIRLS